MLAAVHGVDVEALFHERADLVELSVERVLDHVARVAPHLLGAERGLDGVAAAAAAGRRGRLAHGDRDEMLRERAGGFRARLREQLVHGALAARGHIQGPLVLAAVVVAAAGLVRLHRTGSLRRLLGAGAAALVLAVQQRLRVIAAAAKQRAELHMGHRVVLVDAQLLQRRL